MGPRHCGLEGVLLVKPENGSVLICGVTIRVVSLVPASMPAEVEAALIGGLARGLGSGGAVAVEPVRTERAVNAAGITVAGTRRRGMGRSDLVKVTERGQLVCKKEERNMYENFKELAGVKSIMT